MNKHQILGTLYIKGTKGKFFELSDKSVSDSVDAEAVAVATLGEYVPASIAPAEAVVPATPTPARDDQLALSGNTGCKST